MESQGPPSFGQLSYNPLSDNQGSRWSSAGATAGHVLALTELFSNDALVVTSEMMDRHI